MFLSNLHFLHFIPDIINLIFFLFFLIYFCARYHIKKNIIIILSIFLLTPFLFYFLFPWGLFPDQSKYADIIYDLRNLNYDKSISFLLSNKVDFSSLIYAFFPVPFVTTIISVSLINKGILYAVILYLFNKKKYFLVNLLLFLPSIIFYSSVALREMLVIGLGITFFYIFLEKKNYFQSFFFAALLILTKPHFGIACLAVSIGYYIFFIKLNLNVINKIAFYFFTLSIIFFFIFLFFFQDLLINHREGFFLEEFSYKLLMRDETITISTILNSFIQFLLSPLFTKELSLWTITIFIENLFLLYVLVILLNKIYKENQSKAIFWFLTWLFLFTIFGFVIFNAGTIWRYKFVLQIVMISAMYFSLNNKKKYINLL